MKQHEAVIQVMENNGGFATLGFLYQNVLKVPNCNWKTKTPYASIRRIVQDERFFFKIKSGLWALKSEKNNVLKKLSIDSLTPKRENEFNHTYYQGLLVEIGNLEGFETYIPQQDKNRLFLSKPLSLYAKLEKIHEFTYEKIINSAKTIDVVWFNERKFPNNVFEVEHTTNFRNSLIKFLELQDFNISFSVVADNHRKKEFDSTLLSCAFKTIKDKINFLSYESLSDLHSNTIKYHESKKLTKL